MSNYYDILEVPQNATLFSIKKAYRNKAFLYHPDVNKSPDAAFHFILINQAYHTLSDPVKRTHYDSQLALKLDDMISYDEFLKQKKEVQQKIKREQEKKFQEQVQKVKNHKWYPYNIYISNFKLTSVILLSFGLLLGILILLFNTHWIYAFICLPFVCGGVYLSIKNYNQLKFNLKYYL
jgi:hypothetical protein